MAPAAIVVASVHALLLGLPLFLIFPARGWINLLSCAIAGSMVAAIPAGMLTWSLWHAELRTNASIDGVATMTDGVPTAAGWAKYAEFLIYPAGFGASRG